MHTMFQYLIQHPRRFQLALPMCLVPQTAVTETGHSRTSSSLTPENAIPLNGTRFHCQQPCSSLPNTPVCIGQPDEAVNGRRSQSAHHTNAHISVMGVSVALFIPSPRGRGKKYCLVPILVLLSDHIPRFFDVRQEAVQRCTSSPLTRRLG